MPVNLVTWDNIKSTLKDGHINWREFFDDRQLKEIEFSMVYLNQFGHGTDGHNAKLIIARMSTLLDSISHNITIEVEKE